MSARGFTLVELLVVVAILSAAALAAFGLMSEDRSQVRVDDTRVRLALLRRATLGLETPAYGGEVRLSGFVADNGRLPRNIGELLKRPEGSEEQKGVAVAFYSELAGTCFPNKGSEESPNQPEILMPDEAAMLLLKGHRGNYLGGHGEFRDGWGNVDVDAEQDALDFGWHVDAVNDDELRIKSLGADNAVDGEDGATATGLPEERDEVMTIAANDWQVPLEGWQIIVRNARRASDSVPAPTGEGNGSGEGGSGEAGNEDDPNEESGGGGEGHEDDDTDSGELTIGNVFASTSGVTGFEELAAALLVYENSVSEDGSGQWRQFRSNATHCVGAADKPSTENPSKLVAGGYCVLRFTDENACDRAKVPLGRHLLVLTSKSGKLPVALNNRIFVPIDFHPGVHQPNVVWEIR
jgi:prepilin-type N-terminal cleavage/methylation domain-containing protein